jgi:hypothetical protein
MPSQVAALAAQSRHSKENRWIVLNNTYQEVEK